MSDQPAVDSDPILNIFDPSVAANPQPLWRRLAKELPVGQPIPGMTCISSYEHVMFALRHPEIFSSEMPQGMIGNARPLIPLQIDPPRQVRYRKLLDPLFSNKRVSALEPGFRKLAADLIDRFVDDGECEFNRDFAIPYPCTVFLELMGLPQEDLAHFLEIKDAIIRPQGATVEEVDKVRDDAAAKIYAYFNDFLDMREKNPRDDLMTRIIQTEVGGERLTREEVLDVSYLFIIAGLDTVTATLGCSIAYLAQNSDQRQLLIDEPELLESAVEELLRWETPVPQIVRMAKEDIELGGFPIKAGDLVTLVLGAANLDDALMPNADVVDFRRKPNRHITFGGGNHRCLGSHLARQELMIAIEELHRRIPDYRLKPGETPRYSPAIREVHYLPLVFGKDHAAE